jgi:hypothetical protein
VQAVVLTGVVWLERIVWLTNQSQLFLVPILLPNQQKKKNSSTRADIHYSVE